MWFQLPLIRNIQELLSRRITDSMAGDPSSLRLVGAILLTSVGAMTIFFVRRNENLEWNERIENEGTSESNTEPWSDKTYGKGTFTIEIDVSATSPGPPPTPQDNGEEVTVTWTAVFFDVAAELQ